MNISEILKAAAQKIPPEKRSARGRKAVNGRWKKYREGSLLNRPLDNDRFRALSAGIHARDIASGLGVSVAAVNSWRRLANPVPLSAENGTRFLEWLKNR